MGARRGLTRRGLLGAGAAGALGAALGRGASPAEAAAGSKVRSDAPNVLVIVLEGARSDFVGIYHDSDDLAKTPHLDSLSDESLRFRHAVPESMPSVPARRALLTGERSFPFRDWKPTAGWPRDPGWSKIRASQPLLTDVLQKGGVTTGYVTDNPYLIGPNFADLQASLDVWRPLYSQASYRNFNHPITTPVSAEAANRYVLPKLRALPVMDRMREYVAYNNLHRHKEDDYSAARVFAEGMRQLEALKDRGPFFLVVDAFEPTAPYDPPAKYRKGSKAKGVQDSGIDPIQPFSGAWGVTREVDIDDGTHEAIRQLYADEMTFVDAWIGKLLNKLDDLKLADDTVVYFLSTSGTSLGEHGLWGIYPPAAHPETYEVPYMIRDPDRRRAGETTGYFASTHDVATTALSYFNLRAPGKMDGEDLTVLFDDDEDKRDPPDRDYFTVSISDMVLCGNNDWLMIADSEGHIKRLYNTKEDPDHKHEVGSIHPATTRGLFRWAVSAAGGTLPRFGPDGAIRPFAQHVEHIDQNDLNGPDVAGNGVIGG